MMTTPGTSERPLRATLPSLCLSALVIGAALLPHAAAQAPRNGVRIEYTAIDTQGGQAGRAFLPISSRDVIRQDDNHALDGLDAMAPRCAGALELLATAKQNRGAIREVRLSLTLRVPATLPLTSGACPGAFVQTVLEDGTILSGGRGEVVVTNIVLPGRIAGFVSGSFTQTAMRNGTPVTIRGEFRIPLPAPAARGATRPRLGS